MKGTTILIFLCSVLPFGFGDLSIGFYASTCPLAEDIVGDVVQARFIEDSSITAGLLRMHFHDCFVRGCDASILIDPIPAKNRTSEKIAKPNLTIRGYEIIDEAKTILEEICPLTVSCADILTLATRDAVALSGGPTYLVPTGRRDGLLSDPSQVKLPGPNLNVSESFSFFTAIGLTLDDMVTLLGAHTVGFAHCNSFQRRLANLDPTLDPIFRASLAQQCRILSNTSIPSVFLESNTPDVFDNLYYNQISQSKGVLNIDQQLALDPSSKDLVSNYSVDINGFQQKFADAMIKMGSIGVLVGTNGEIRKNCRAFNFPK